MVKTLSSRLKPPKFILILPFLSYLALNILLVSAMIQYSYQSQILLQMVS